MSAKRLADNKRSACDYSHIAEENFACFPQDNRKGRRAVNSCCVSDLEPFSYASLAYQQINVTASMSFSSLRSSSVMDVENFEGNSEGGDGWYSFMKTASKATCRQNSQLIPF